MTNGSDEGRVLLREAKRAGVHYLILRIGVPVVGVFGILVISEIVQRFKNGEPVEAVMFGLFCGAAVILAGRWLWRLAKR